MHDEMLTYGLNGDSELVHIDNPRVHKGKDCGCVCPNCKKPLFARRGDINQHHFAHAPGFEPCGKGKMTALHLLAQKILEERRTILLPPYEKDFVKKEAQLKTFDNVTLEEFSKVEDVVLRPDCVCRKDDSQEPLWVEIFCRHEVDKDKRREIEARRTYCVEIDFRDLLETDYKESDVIARLESDNSHKEWICCPAWDDLNEKLRLQAEQEESERQRIEKAYQEHQQKIRRELQQEVVSWFQTKQSELADSFIQRIKSNPFSDEVTIADVLIPGFDFIAYIDSAPKNEDGKRVFYTLLNYYYNKVTNINYSDIKRKANTFLYIQDDLSAEEKVKLEELMSLRILYILERNRKRFYDVDIDDAYKTCIKKYIADSEIRNAVLMVASVLYHHVVGSEACNFGELTQEIILHQPSLAKLYLTVIDSQDKYPNDYTLDGRDMLAELRQFVQTHNVEANEYVSNILQDCFDFAFKTKPESQERSSHYEPYGYDKVFAGQNMNDAWAQLNKAFNEQ